MARYDLTRFKTTHNSYSGGLRGPLRKQLDLGIRNVELDFHDNGYGTLSDYRLGHLKPGSEVALGGGNPDTPLFRAWLGAIAEWSADHPGHAPITVTLDAKDDLTDNEEGDLEDLNHTLESAFGPRLFTREERDAEGAWPETDDLRDRVLCVLSGNGSTRAAYRWSYGSEPAIAANGRGDVVLAYRTTAGDLAGWTGTARPGLGIEWRRKAVYGFAAQNLGQPALALDDDGWVVEVHSFGPPMGFDGPLLESSLGRLQDDGRIEWYKPDVFADGSAPRLAWRDAELVVTYRPWSGQSWRRKAGRVDRRRRRVSWQTARASSEPLPPHDAVGAGVRCLADAEGVIRAGFAGDLRPVRHRQIVFVEEQQGDDRRVIRDALFFAAGSKNRDAVSEARARGQVARAWGYAEEDRPAPPAPGAENMPATDTPQAAWYADYMAGPGVAV